MKSFAIFIAILFLALNGIATFNEKLVIGEEEENVMKLKILLGEPIIANNIISFDKCMQKITPYRPILPVYTKTLVFPAGTKISIEVMPDEIKSMGKIRLSSSYIPAPPGFKMKRSGYDENIVYPEEWYSYNLMAGLKNGKHVTIAKINIYPARFVKGEIIYSSNFDLVIRYDLPSENLFLNDAYDLLIICPSYWNQELQALKEHKEKYGIKTKIVTTDEIYGSVYFPCNGRDDAEKIKYFIKNAIEEWGIKYVLLVGGRKIGIKEEWHVPVRYVHVYWADESKYISDLYYTDVYDGNYSFSSWDTDGNGVYGEWNPFGNLQDEMDLYPDVYVGRLACRNKLELKLMVNKIIEYENDKIDKKVVLAGGDNFEDKKTNYYEGEVVGDKTLEYLPNFEAEKVYASQMDVTAEAIKKALGKGAMFMHLHGHGSPIYWSTHKPNGFDKWEKGIGIWDLPFFFNEEEPIVVLGGCHTAMFNVSITIHPWTGGIPAPEGLSWWFARKYNGGGIASLGYTCFPVATPGEEGDLDGDGINEPDCVESGYGYMQLSFFYAYGIKGMEYLGQCWGFAVSRYIEHFKIPYERWHLHTIHGFVLLGDPSLKIGGYGA